jgi:hypothetical protein
MTEFLIDLGVLVILLTLLVGWLAAWRIGQVVSWQALAKTALATHSFTDCVALIRFCAEERELVRTNPARGQRLTRERTSPSSVFERRPRVS